MKTERCPTCGCPTCEHLERMFERLHERELEGIRFRTALEEIVGGVYATGRNPRDIAKRVLDGAIPTALQGELQCSNEAVRKEGSDGNES